MSLTLRLIFALTTLVSVLFAGANHIIDAKISGDSLLLSFSNNITLADIKPNTLDVQAKSDTYRQFVDIKAALGIKAQIFKNTKIAHELKISQFDKEHVRVVALLDKSQKLIFKASNKTLLIQNNLTQNEQKQLPKQESEKLEKPTNPLQGVRLELEKPTGLIDSESSLPTQIAKESAPYRKKLIVLDPGHGGKDSGAIGIDSRREKDVVFAVAIITKELLEKKGYEVAITRSGDYFIELQERTRFANSKSADLFLSIHANAVDFKHSDPGKAKGVETFFLSPARSDRAKRAAEKENGESMDAMDALTKGAFLNVLNREKIVASNKLAIDIHRFVLSNIRAKFKDSTDGGVREAPFWVLVGAQMPAILLEIGYITNPDEAARFDNATFRALLARGIVDGVDSYFDNN